ncbi:NAD(P)H-dependent FMN reductase [Mesorhizobium sp. J18]|uniref:NADPH-dependent FMN reductase n=1 Tax=Mesorhizobium sp. J18 TaxID=935263 RepID=UPI001199A4A0|nr:NAD(P)H-dependent oxidoreductase [Mesorhizobium sp. J18]TWG96873.1 NAD(P)H-dependent FMN reductase [Mesorhizobium sp. J18]
MSKPKIGIIVGTTRAGRFSEKPAAWIAEVAKARDDMDVEIVDLRDYPMPFFDEPASPAWAPSKNEVAQRWQKKIAELDGYIIVAAEYNHAPTAVLKNALDYAYNEWSNKPVAFVGYGGTGGARAVEQLRLIAVELQMAPTRTGVHIMWPVMVAVKDEGKNLADFDFLQQGAKDMLDQLSWWAHALKTARDADAQKKSQAA